MRYFHELTDEELKSGIEGIQPQWCGYPDAVQALGCWSLLSDRKSINREKCSFCEFFKEE